MAKQLNFTGGDWARACDSYGKVRHSEKACVYTTVKGEDGERIVAVAARIPNWDDAKVMAAAKDLYSALKYMNHVENGYCICPRNNGMLPDEKHATVCADARKAIRKVESDWAEPNYPEAEIAWMAETQEVR